MEALFGPVSLQGFTSEFAHPAWDLPQIWCSQAIRRRLNSRETFEHLNVLGCLVMAPPPGHSQAVLPNPGMLVLERIDRYDSGFEIVVTTRYPAACPLCKRISTSQHSKYNRRLSDLPWQGISVRIWLSLHRYRCGNHQCPRKVFCERVPGVAKTYARYTERLDEIVCVVGYVAGGLPGARLLDRPHDQRSQVRCRFSNLSAGSGVSTDIRKSWKCTNNAYPRKRSVRGWA